MVSRLFTGGIEMVSHMPGFPCYVVGHSLRAKFFSTLNFGSSRPLKNFLLYLAVIAFRLLGVSTVHC